MSGTGPASSRRRGTHAPGSLLALQRFVNSVDIDRRVDAWQSPAEWGEWLEREGIGAGAGVGRDELRRCIEVREALRELLLANAGATLDPAALTALNRAGGGAPSRVSFDPAGRTRLYQSTAGVDRAIGSVLAAVVVAQSEGTWSRLKACRDEQCLWAFYDTSKNASGTWCSMAICGNRAKARRYRARRRDEGRAE